MRFVKIGLIVLASFVGLAALAVTSSAQGNNNGNPSILQAIQALQGTVNGLVTNVNSLTTTVNNIDESTTSGNVLFTPPIVAFVPDTLSCTVTNVTDVARAVTITLIDGNTAATLTTTSTTIGPGLSSAVFKLASAGGTRAFCRIEVTSPNGSKHDVRGVLALFGASNASDRDPIAAQ